MKDVVRVSRELTLNSKKVNKSHGGTVMSAITPQCPNPSHINVEMKDSTKEISFYHIIVSISQHSLFKNTDVQHFVIFFKKSIIQAHAVLTPASRKYFELSIINIESIPLKKRKLEHLFKAVRS